MGILVNNVGIFVGFNDDGFIVGKNVGIFVGLCVNVGEFEDI